MKGHLAFITSFFEPFIAASTPTAANNTRGGSEAHGVSEKTSTAKNEQDFTSQDEEESVGADGSTKDQQYAHQEIAPAVLNKMRSLDDPSSMLHHWAAFADMDDDDTCSDRTKKISDFFNEPEYHPVEDLEKVTMGTPKGFCVERTCGREGSPCSGLGYFFYFQEDGTLIFGPHGLKRPLFVEQWRCGQKIWSGLVRIFPCEGDTSKELGVSVNGYGRRSPIGQAGDDNWRVGDIVHVVCYHSEASGSHFLQTMNAYEQQVLGCNNEKPNFDLSELDIPRGYDDVDDNDDDDDYDDDLPDDAAKSVAFPPDDQYELEQSFRN